MHELNTHEEGWLNSLSQHYPTNYRPCERRAWRFFELRAPSPLRSAPSMDAFLMALPITPLLAGDRAPRIRICIPLTHTDVSLRSTEPRPNR